MKETSFGFKKFPGMPSSIPLQFPKSIISGKWKKQFIMRAILYPYTLSAKFPPETSHPQNSHPVYSPLVFKN